MASFYWIKLYHEILDDPKMGKLPDRAWRRCVELFLLAGDTEEGGALPELSDIAWRLRVPEDELLEDLQTLEAVGILGQNDGHWHVSNFAKRQKAVADDERQRQYRKRRRTRNESVMDVTGDNAGCHESVTERNADKSRKDKKGEDTEKDSAAGTAKPSKPPPETPPPEKKPTPAQEMFDALGRLCQYDLTMISRKDRGVLNQVGKRLRDNEKTPDDLAGFARYWYAADWRGQKGQAPKPHDVTSEWGRAQAWLENGGKNARRNERRSKPVDASEAEKRQIEKEQSEHVRRVLERRAAGVVV